MRIVWTSAAVSDLEAIRDYIARDSDFYALRFVQRIVDAVELLRKFPELGEVLAEFGERGVRQRIVQSYRILYRVRSDHVSILTIVHASRDLASLDLEP